MHHTHTHTHPHTDTDTRSHLHGSIACDIPYGSVCLRHRHHQHHHHHRRCPPCQSTISHPLLRRCAECRDPGTVFAFLRNRPRQRRPFSMPFVSPIILRKRFARVAHPLRLAEPAAGRETKSTQLSEVTATTTIRNNNNNNLPIPPV